MGCALLVTCSWYLEKAKQQSVGDKIMSQLLPCPHGKLPCTFYGTVFLVQRKLLPFFLRVLPEIASNKHLWSRIALASRLQGTLLPMNRLFTISILLACLHSCWAGCPSALGIYSCNGPRNPCSATTCPSGQVCHVNNCGGCKANCEAPGMVHIMSVGPTPSSQDGLGGPLVEQITGETAA